jgi:benzodiazapine receptor
LRNIFKVSGRINIWALLISIILAEVIGIILPVLTVDIKESLATLNKPVFLSSSWPFPMLWAIIYIFIALAAYRVWMIGKRGINVKCALVLYLVQLLLVFLWYIIFFKFKFIGLSFFEIVLLLGFIIFTVLEFKKYDRISAILIIPYIVLVAFATISNYFFWILNFN